MSKCCLCSNLVAGRQRQRWDEPLFLSANFIALPSLGSIIEGWIIIVPKAHFLSIGAMPADLAKEMMDFRNRAVEYLSPKYGAMCAFEHGPSSLKRQVGCSVDHAHLHLVPIDFDLISAARPYLPQDIQWSDADLNKCRLAFAQGRDYLYIEQPIDTAQIAVHNEFGSQIFRKAIASRLGVPDRYSWRDYPYHENIMRTIQSLRAAAAS